MSGAAAAAWLWVRNAWDRVAIYLPVILMGVLALGTYWMVRNTPALLGGGDAQRVLTHEPDYFMRGFSVKTFDGAGRLKSEVFGAEARHYPDTDTLEIDQPRIRSYNQSGVLTVATARRAVSNADASQVQLIGDALVTRESTGPKAAPKLEIRGEFLHAFFDSERVVSHKPVRITRGNDEFRADSLEYDNLDRTLNLRGGVRGLLAPRQGAH